MILSQKFSQSVNLTKQGKLIQSQQILSKLIQRNPKNFALLINYSTVLIQLGQYQNALTYLGQAIKLEPYSFIAYYNRFLCNYSVKNYLNSLNDLKSACSCLYAGFGFQSDDIKYLNRAIKECQGNFNAYVLRGKLNQNRSKIGLAINDFERSTYQLPQTMSQILLANLYYQKAMFYRRIKKNEDFQQALQMYLFHNGNISKNQVKINSQFFDLSMLVHPNKVEINLNDALKQIQTLVQQFNKEFKNYNQFKCKKKITDSLKEKQQILKPTQTEDNLLQEQQFSQSSQQNHTDSIHPSENDDSQTLQQKIEKLQREIIERGGKIPDSNQEEPKDEQFLEYQISKAVQELEQVKNDDPKKHQKIAESDNLAASQVKSVGSVNSLGSKLSSTKQLTQQEMEQYNSFTIEIVSVKLFKQDSKDSYIKLTYGDWSKSTKKAKKQWRQKFDGKIIQDNFQIYVQMFDKGGLWRSDSESGEGSINLRQKGQTKCVLELKSIKIGVLYYKLKLHRKSK